MGQHKEVQYQCKASTTEQQQGYMPSRDEWQHGRMVQNNSRSKARQPPILFNIFLERIMSDVLKKHDRRVSIGDKNNTILRFADDIDALAED